MKPGTWLSRIVIDVHANGYSIKCTCGFIEFAGQYDLLAGYLEYHVIDNCPLTSSLDEWKEPNTSEARPLAASMSDSPGTTNTSPPLTDTWRRWPLKPWRRPSPSSDS